MNDLCMKDYKLNDLMFMKEHVHYVSMRHHYNDIITGTRLYVMNRLYEVYIYG
jgi:hypothetical protein